MKRFLTYTALLSMAATTLLTTSCKKERENEPTQEVITLEKKHDTALLLVTFGSTFDEPHVTYKKQREAFAKAFPNTDMGFSFTSKTCINRWQAAKNEQFVTPNMWLEWFLKKQYKTVLVQSLHVIPGEEFTVLRDGYVKKFYNRAKDEKYDPAVLGNPLLQSDKDIKRVAKILCEHFAKELKQGDAVAMMGHGNPEEYYDFANQSYRKLEQEMRAYAKATYQNDAVYVGTVDYPPMLIDYVLGQLENTSCKTKKIHLMPLMTIAGDHANNDMASTDTEEDGKPIPLEEQSWLNQLKAKGWNVTPHLIGLGDIPAINEIWIEHLKEAITAAAESDKE